MAKFGTLAAGALALSTALGAAEQADAQAIEIKLPHPDGEISVDVSRVAYETQADILSALQGCLQEGFTFADANEDGKIEGDEQYDWDDERAFCAESAERQINIASSEARQAAMRDNIELANAEQDALRTQIASDRARAEEARQRINELTEGAMQDISSGS